MKLERIVLLHPCPLCPDPDDCDGHEERDEARLSTELVMWITLPELRAADVRQSRGKSANSGDLA